MLHFIAVPKTNERVFIQQFLPRMTYECANWMYENVGEQSVSISALANGSTQYKWAISSILVDMNSYNIVIDGDDAAILFKLTWL